MIRSYPNESFSSLGESVQPFKSWILASGALAHPDYIQKQFQPPNIGPDSQINSYNFQSISTVNDGNEPRHFLAANELHLASEGKRNHIEEILRRKFSENASGHCPEYFFNPRNNFRSDRSPENSVSTHNNNYYKLPTEENNRLSGREHSSNACEQKVNGTRDQIVSTNHSNRVLKRKHDFEYGNRFLATANIDSNENGTVSTQRAAFHSYHRTGHNSIFVDFTAPSTFYTHSFIF